MSGKNITLSLLAILLAVSLGWAQNITLLGQYGYWSTAIDLAKNGSYVYVVDGGAFNLRILDVSNPTEPAEVGSFTIPNQYTSQICLYGNYAYLTGGENLYILSLANPISPQLIGVCAVSYYYNSGAALAYPYLFIVADYDEIRTVDVSNPVSPAVVDTLSIPGGYLQGLAIEDSRLYVASGEMGLQIFDISNPLSPSWVGYYRTPNCAREIAVQDSFAYVLDGMDEWMPAAGLMILDVSDPTQPSHLSSYGAYVRNTEIQVHGDYAYIAGWGYDYGSHLRIVDVSNPLAPQEVNHFLHDGNSGALCLADSLLYLAGEGLTILDVTTPPSPEWLSQWYPGYGVREIAVHGSYAYGVNYSHGGLDVVDISNPAEPEWLSFSPSPGTARNVALDWPYAYLADLTGGLRIINVSNPLQPSEVAFYDPVSPNLTVSEVALNSPYAYLAGGSGGLMILNVSDPANPLPVDSVVGIQPYLIKVDGSYLYTAEASASPFDGMRIFSLADPTHPVQVGSATFSGTVQDMDIQGSYAYVTTSSTLFIFNVSNPTAPYQIYSSTAWDGYSLDVAGSLLYVVRSDFFVLNVANPGAPSQVGLFDLTGSGRGITVVDSIAYMGQSSYFGIFDCSACFAIVTVALEPINPPIVIPASGGSFHYTVTVSNGLPQPYAAQAWTTVRLPNQTWYGPLLGPITLTLPPGISLSRQRLQDVPASAPAGTYLYETRLGTYPNQITALDNFAFVKSSAGTGNAIENWTCDGEPFTGEDGFNTDQALPLQFGILGVAPNPFNPITAISYKLQATSHVSLKVYDTAGRLVATLVDGWREAGTHCVTFNGAGLASGIYLYVITAGSAKAVGKMMLVK